MAQRYTRGRFVDTASLGRPDLQAPPMFTPDRSNASIQDRYCFRKGERMRSNRRKKTFAKSVAKGTAKGLGKLGKGIVTGVVSELASIVTLGLFRPPRRRR